MSTTLPFANNTLTTYVYEPFSYTISNPPGSSTLSIASTAGIPPGYLSILGTNAVFTTTSNGMVPGTSTFTVLDSSGNASSNTVNVKAGRFLDSNSNSFDGQIFTFYKNEPITPIKLVAPFAISTPTSVPTLPPGFIYTSNASNIYSITGTPLVVVPQSNYLIIGNATGSNVGKIVTSKIGLSVSNERIRMSLTGSDIVNNMTVDTPISQRVITSAYPPYPSGGSLRYTWSGLPDGITVKDAYGTVQSSPFMPSDLSATIIISGAPTITAANAYRNANITSNTVTFTATRTFPTPLLSNVTPITFSFGETVLFDPVSVLPLYSGVTLDPSAIYFRAQTYFKNTSSAIASITAPIGLPPGLSLSYSAGSDRAYLIGTPSFTGSANYTVRATNTNTISRDISVPITIENDSVSFLYPTPVDACYNFVLSRPASLALTGYYPSNIQFKASAASKKPVTFTAPSLAGTGLSLSNVDSNTVQIVGVPNTVTPLSTVTVTASAIGTPATATRDIKLAVLNDVITISAVPLSSLTFIQNKAITPVQLTASTLSGVAVISYVGTDLPSGVSVSATGLISGTPTGFTVGTSTFTITASTGFATGSRVYTYQIIEDNVLVVIPTTTVTVPTLFSNVEFDIITYSGSAGSLTSFYGTLGIQPPQSTMATLTTTPPNLLSGDFSNVPVLAPEYRFYVEGQAGSFASTSLIRAVASGAPTIQHSALILDNITYPAYSTVPAPVPKVTGRIAVSTDTPVTFPNTATVEPDSTGPSVWTTTYSFSNVEGLGFDLARSSNIFIAVLGSNILRSVDWGNTWSTIASSNITTVSNVLGMQYAGIPSPSPPTLTRIRFANPTFGAITTDGGSNWWAIGVGTTGGDSDTWVPVSVIRKSTDNGQTWSDTVVSSGTLSAALLSSNKLYYNQNRLFYTGRQIVVTPGLSESNAFYYADTGDLTTWTKPLTTLGDQGSITGLAFSNSTAFAAGDYSNGTATFVSTDNGTNWSSGTNPNPGPGSITTGWRYADVYQKYGKWFLAGISNGIGFLQSSSNLTVWESRGGALPGSYSATTENGITWLSGGNGVAFQTNIWSNDGSLVTDSTLSTNLSSILYLKRLYSDTTLTPSNPTLTLSVVYDSSGIAFTSPTQTTYTNWQYVPISTIPIEATNPSVGSFLYYYASGLPRGLTLNLDASGIEASITGTPSQYSDAFQRVVLYATLNPGVGGGTAALPLYMRTILPTVQKQQSSAGAWTSMIRQYTVVNAAQNSLNGRTLPATEPPLGEFIRPQPPDSVSATGDPNCVSTRAER